MSNPVINFRMSKYHLARGLQIIRQLEPNFKLISVSHIVKTVYFDYLAKMSLNKDDQVPIELLEEIKVFTKKPVETGITLESIINKNEEQSEDNEQSKKSSVTDFSPPEDWEG